MNTDLDEAEIEAPDYLRTRLDWALEEDAQDGRPEGIPGACTYGRELQDCGVERTAETANVFLSSLAARSRALCAREEESCQLLREFLIGFCGDSVHDISLKEQDPEGQATIARLDSWLTYFDK